MTRQEYDIQESQYDFPYHYLVDWDGTRYHQHQSINWGYIYLSYVLYVRQRVLDHGDFEGLLDVGCGDGRFLNLLSRDVPGYKLVGIDYFQPAIALAKALKPQVEFLCGDVTADCFGGRRFELATLIDVFEHIPPDLADDFVAGIRRHVRDDGTLYVTVPHVNTPVQAKHYRHFDCELLARSMAPHFELEETRHMNSRLGGCAKLVKRLLANKVFQIHYPPLLGKAFRWYLDSHQLTDEPSCTRIFCRLRAA